MDIARDDGNLSVDVLAFDKDGQRHWERDGVKFLLLGSQQKADLLELLGSDLGDLVDDSGLTRVKALYEDQ